MGVSELASNFKTHHERHDQIVFVSIGLSVIADRDFSSFLIHALDHVELEQFLQNWKSTRNIHFLGKGGMGMEKKRERPTSVRILMIVGSYSRWAFPNVFDLTNFDTITTCWTASS